MTETSVNWFEIPVQDLGRASAFYTTVLEIELGDMDGPSGPMKTFQNGEMPIGALVQGPQFTPSQEGSLIYLGTSDIDAALKRVAASGGQELVPKTSIGPFGNIGQFIDSEGNRMALHSN